MKYYYSLEYLSGNNAPESTEQKKSLNDFNDFLNGKTPEGILNSFVRQIGRITSGKADKWEICFVPADSSESTICRYEALAENLYRKTGVSTRRGALSWKGGRNDRNPEFECSGDTGRNVILIDALVDSGKTLNAAAAALVNAGALSVTGLVAAKSINPSYLA